MKKFLLVFLAFLMLDAAFASVEESGDINIVRGALNLDDSLSFFQGSESVTFTSNAGTVQVSSTVANNPVPLEINGQLRITGGNPGAGKLLASDATGLTSWVSPGSGGGIGDGHSLDAADGAPQDMVFVNSEGRVGIDTKNPLTELHIRSNFSNSDITLESNDGFMWTMSSVVGGSWVLNRNVPGDLPAIIVEQSGKVRTVGPIESGGQITSASGGFKFPDGTVQTTAANQQNTVAVPRGTWCGMCLMPSPQQLLHDCLGVNVCNRCPAGYSRIDFPVVGGGYFDRVCIKD